MNDSNPFASTDMPGAVAAGGPLYTVNAIGGTAFFGSLLAGGVLLVLNARRSGQSMLLVGGQAVGAAVLVFLAAALDSIGVPSIVYGLGQALIAQALCRMHFGGLLAAQEEAGIPPATWMHGALLCLVALTVQVLVVGWMLWMFGLDALLAS